VTTVRFSPPWDIADHSTTSPAGKVLTVEQACFDYWLRDLAAHGVTPEIAFKPDYNYQSGNRIMIPDLSTYQAAMTAFTAQYSNCPGTPATCADGLARVSIIAPWGNQSSVGRQRQERSINCLRSFICAAAVSSTPPTARLTPPTPIAARRWPRRCG